MIYKIQEGPLNSPDGRGDGSGERREPAGQGVSGSPASILKTQKEPRSNSFPALRRPASSPRSK